MLDAGVKLWDACVNAMDGERDPRCLLFALDLAAAVVELYREQPVDSLPAAEYEVIHAERRLHGVLCPGGGRGGGGRALLGSSRWN